MAHKSLGRKRDRSRPVSYTQLMNAAWIELSIPGAPGGARRVALGPGTTRLGGGAADFELEGVGEDQLHISLDPPRAVFVGSGPPPFIEDAPLQDRLLHSGDRIEWAGGLLEFKMDAALEELPSEAPAQAHPSGLSQAESQAWGRVRAGLLMDLGLVDKKMVGRWQREVLAGEFDSAACAEELQDTAVIAFDAKSLQAARLVDRSGILLRDFLMASRLKGAAGVGRAVRTRAKSGLAMVLSQTLALVVYSIIVILCMLFVRIRGVSWDGIFDSIRNFFGGN